MDYTVLLNKMLIFLVLMIIGYALARRGKLDRSAVKAVSALTLNIFLTASILNSTLSVDVDMDWGELGRAFLLVWVVMLLGYLVAWLVSLPIPVDREHKPLFELLMSMGKTGQFGDCVH